MNANSSLIAALVAAIVSIFGTFFTIRATSRLSRVETQQEQFKEILQKRVEFYPQLWAIHIRHETNWMIEEKPKTREWARDYLAALNEFNLTGGIFFSQEVYAKFVELRAALIEAVAKTESGNCVSSELAEIIRRIVYGDQGQGPGLSTHLKDDLGSYRAVLLQRRDSDQPGRTGPRFLARRSRPRLMRW